MEAHHHPGASGEEHPVDGEAARREQQGKVPIVDRDRQEEEEEAPAEGRDEERAERGPRWLPHPMPDEHQ